MKLAQVAGDSDCLYESAPHSLKANDINEPWWNGIILTPVKERPGLLPQIALDGIWRMPIRQFRPLAALAQ